MKSAQQCEIVVTNMLNLQVDPALFRAVQIHLSLELAIPWKAIEVPHAGILAQVIVQGMPHGTHDPSPRVSA